MRKNICDLFGFDEEEEEDDEKLKCTKSQFEVSLKFYSFVKLFCVYFSVDSII